MNLKNFQVHETLAENCPASARIISSFDFKHRTSYNISFIIGHLPDSLILLPRQECFVKMLSYSNLSSLLDM